MPDDQEGEVVTRNGTEEGTKSERINPQPMPDIPSSPPAKSVVNKDVENAVQAMEDRVRRAERLMIILTAAIALFALCSVIVGIFQWQVMSGQLKEMKTGGVDTHNLAIAAGKQADAAAKQAEAMRLDQRAWISILALGRNPSAVGQPFNIYLSVVNNGKTLASNVFTKWFDCFDCSESEIRYSFKSTDVAGPLPPFISPGTQPGSSLVPGGIGSMIGIGFFGSAPITGDFWKKFNDGKTLSVMSGEIAYDDIFNAHHFTRFCMVMRPNDRWSYCKANNYAD